ncbi:MAG: Hsp20/alpha crystallin family protein [Eubacterium sp.]|jgi:HSP20 family protein|nr:Hsp20/alpha crystallin family protein [Eubacterium sp.]
MFTITPYERGVFNLFDEFEKEFFNLGKTAQTFCKTDIIDKGDKFVLEMEIPGFEKEDINLDIKDDYLIISAEKKSESEKNEKNGSYIRRERSYGAYRRSFDISNVDFDKIGAEYKNGILIVSLPKKGKETPVSRRLEIL